MGYRDAGVRGKYRHFKKDVAGASDGSVVGGGYTSLFIGKAGALRYGPSPSRSSAVNGGDREGALYKAILALGDKQSNQMKDTTEIEIKTVTDQKRGCGWRKPGGLYLISKAVFTSCGLLPLPLSVCPCCGEGVKPARGWTWINPALMFKDRECSTPSKCGRCSLKKLPEQAGLLWVGEMYYETPADFLKEVRQQGVSRRIHSLPHGFELGKTQVFVAHAKAIQKECPAKCRLPENFTGACKVCGGSGVAYGPGIFQVFRPTEIQYVVKGDEEMAELEAMVKRGITLVEVNREGVLGGDGNGEEDDA